MFSSTLGTRYGDAQRRDFTNTRREKSS